MIVWRDSPQGDHMKKKSAGRKPAELEGQVRGLSKLLLQLKNRQSQRNCKAGAKMRFSKQKALNLARLCMSHVSGTRQDQASKDEELSNLLDQVTLAGK